MRLRTRNAGRTWAPKHEPHCVAEVNVRDRRGNSRLGGRLFSSRAEQWKSTVGLELKSTSKVVLSILLGLFMTWTSTYVASGTELQSLFRRPSPCVEASPCGTPWWVVAWLGAWLLGPALVCGAFAAIGIRSQWKTKRVLRWFAITWLATLALIGLSGISQLSETSSSMTAHRATTVIVDL